MKSTFHYVAAVALCFTALELRGQEALLPKDGGPAEASPPTAPQSGSTDKYVSREEYEKLKGELEALKAQMSELAKNGALKPPAEGPAAESTGEAPAAEDAKVVKKEGDAKSQGDAGAIDELRAELAKVKEIAEGSKPGTTHFLLTGYAVAGFRAVSGESSTFSAAFVPIFLWQLSERLFFESELEIELDGNEVEFHLEYAHLTYILNDYMTVGAGAFLSPSNAFGERYHAGWINKLPNQPLAVGEGGLLPFSEVGLQVRGAIPIGPVTLLYAAYVSNGPRLITDDPEAAGTLAFDNYTDLNNNKAVGGRLGLRILPELEIGYGFQFSRVNATEASANHADVRFHVVDLNYTRDIDFLKGGITLWGQWAWSRTSRLTYDRDAALGFGPVSFRNNRDGGFIQLAYRPHKIKAGFIGKLEPVFRFDKLNQPQDAPGGFDESRYTFGLNYWLGASTVLKAAYEFGERSFPGREREDVDAFLVQAAMGF